MARLCTALFFLALLSVASGGLLDGLFGKGDPQFRGLDGRIFYFEGFPGQIFNIISEQDHLLNALFSDGPHMIDTLGVVTNGTFMTSFGLQMFETKVEMTVDEEGEVTASVNGEKIDDDLTASNFFMLEFKEPNGVYISIEKYRPDYGYAITARSALFELILFSTPRQYDPVVEDIVRAHLNFELAANIEALKLTECHGVLGQGALHSKTAALPDRLSTLFLGEGTDEDYIVSDLFAADSTFNLFGKKTIVKGGSSEDPKLNSRVSGTLSAARRSLGERFVPVEYTTFAKVTGLV